MSFESSFSNGMNRGGVGTAAALGDVQILQGFPLSSNGIEGWRAYGCGGSPEKNPGT